jgi:hypothetical protein
MTLMTTTLILVLVYAAAAVAGFGIFAGIPMWMILRRPDTAPDNRLPGYMRPEWENLGYMPRADWEDLPVQHPVGSGR